MLELKNISKIFDGQTILKDISFRFPDTGLIGIQGKSGCGKSTLLYIIGMLDKEFEGKILYNGEEIVHRKQFIRQNISFMMQNKDVISSMSVKENILLASQISHQTYHYSQLKKVTKQLGIADLLNKYPSQLSGGQLKRVSIAKALMKQSSVVLCDEPTGALHEKQAHEVMKLLKDISKDRLIIIVSHDPNLLEMYCDEVLLLEDHTLKGQIKCTNQIIIKDKKKSYHSLIIYSIRQILFQRNKLMFLFLFQWILIVAFFMMITSMNGIWSAIEQSELHSVNSYILTIENKDRTPFLTLPHISNTYVQYHYQLDQFHISSHQKSIDSSLSFLPQEKNHIQLQQGRFPQNIDEVIVSDALYRSIKDNQLDISCEDFQMKFKIVGVLSPSLFQEKEIYCLSSLQSQIDFLKDEYTLIIETNAIKLQKVYQSLSKQYNVYSDILERTESYQSVLSLARLVAYVFISVSLVVSLLLISIVESILYYERKHDVAYLLSLGIETHRLFILSVGEAIVLGTSIAIGGIVFSSLLYYFLNNVYDIQSHYYFYLQLRSIWLSQYDLYVFIIVVYLLMVVLGSLLPIKQIMKIDMIDVLREE